MVAFRKTHLHGTTVVVRQIEMSDSKKSANKLYFNYFVSKSRKDPSALSSTLIKSSAKQSLGRTTRVKLKTSARWRMGGSRVARVALVVARQPIRPIRVATGRANRSNPSDCRSLGQVSLRLSCCASNLKVLIYFRFTKNTLPAESWWGWHRVGPQQYHQLGSTCYCRVLYFQMTLLVILPRISGSLLIQIINFYRQGLNQTKLNHYTWQE